MAGRPTSPGNDDPEALWFTPPDSPGSRRRSLTRERVISEALALISADGAEALSMRGLAAHLGVVPGALYRHVRSKEQLYDLILDGVLAEVDCQPDQSQSWGEQITVLAQRLRTVLEDRPGIAALLKARDPISPHSLALSEALLAPLHDAGLPAGPAVAAYRLIYDYTIGFALGDRTSAGELRVQDQSTRQELRAFLRALPAERFPVLSALGEHVWTADRDEQFAAGLRTIIRGLQLH